MVGNQPHLRCKQRSGLGAVADDAVRQQGGRPVEPDRNAAVQVAPVHPPRGQAAPRGHHTVAEGAELLQQGGGMGQDRRGG